MPNELVASGGVFPPHAASKIVKNKECRHHGRLQGDNVFMVQRNIRFAMFFKIGPYLNLDGTKPFLL